MIKAKTANNEYVDIVEIFAGGDIQKEILKIWSAEANAFVFEATADLTAPLPLTITTDGTALIDYRIYGNTVDGESVGVETENLWDESWVNGLYSGIGIYGPTQDAVASDPNKPIPVQGGATYYIKQFKNVSKMEVFFYSSATTGFISYVTIDPNISNSFVTPQSATYIRFDCYRAYGAVYANDIVISTAFPTAYVPYGYKLPMVSRGDNYREETPIYIGDTKLVKDEYVSYAEQKVYKRTSNLFTPSEDKGYYQGNRFIADDDYLCTPYIPLDDPEYWVKMDFDTTNAPIGGKYGVEWFDDYNVPVYGECIDIRFHAGWTYDGRYEADPEVVVVHTPKYVRAFIHKDCTKVNLSIGSDREHSEYAPYLVPQDPPVPLPVLPTTEGETTFEYDGGEPQPEKMHVKYNRIK